MAAMLVAVGGLTRTTLIVGGVALLLLASCSSESEAADVPEVSTTVEAPAPTTTEAPAASTTTAEGGWADDVREFTCDSAARDSAEYAPADVVGVWYPDGIDDATRVFLQTLDCGDSASTDYLRAIVEAWDAAEAEVVETPPTSAEEAEAIAAVCGLASFGLDQDPNYTPEAYAANWMSLGEDREGFLKTADMLAAAECPEVSDLGAVNPGATDFVHRVAAALRDANS
jgi:hypothetical protein